MSDSQNQPNECKCLGDKKVKNLEKQIAEINEKCDILAKEIEILRKAVKK